MARLWQQFAQRFNRLRAAAGFSPNWFLIPLAAGTGTLGGLAAASFGTLVEWLSETLSVAQQRPTLWVMATLVVLIPALGGLAVGLIQSWLLRTGPIHGVPEVIESLAKERGKLKGRVGVSKAVTSTCTLGTGGSAGMEGPIITIGATLGSKIAQWLHIKPEHYPTLIGCGAASATAGIFNAPIAGVLFVLEVILRDFSVRTFMPIVVASVFGTAVSQEFFTQLGSEHDSVAGALFQVPPEMMIDYRFALSETPAYMALGLVCGMVGLGLAASLRLSDRLWRKVPSPDYARPAIGGLLLGAMGLLFIFLFPANATIEENLGYHQPVFMGNGYAVIESLLKPETYNAATIGIWLLLAILLFKIVGTALTIGSGGSGGIIAPSLFVGAASGALLAVALQKTGYFPGATPATYALAGMAGAIAASLHCPLTAFLLVFEITQDYKVILPIMLVAIISTTTAQFLHRDSVYSDLLRRRGIRLGQVSDLSILRRIQVSDVPRAHAVLVNADDPAQRLIDLATDYAVADFVVVDAKEHYIGMVVGEDLRTTLVQREAIPLMIVAELMRTNLPTVQGNETLDVVLDKFAKHEVSSLPIVAPEGYVSGMVTRSRLLQRYQEELDKRG
ncbi:MAG: chloride channel protein [Phycisphaerales bacterium JB063]